MGKIGTIATIISMASFGVATTGNGILKGLQKERIDSLVEKVAAISESKRTQERLFTKNIPQKTVKTFQTATKVKPCPKCKECEPCGDCPKCPQCDSLKHYHIHSKPTDQK